MRGGDGEMDKRRQLPPLPMTHEEREMEIHTHTQLYTCWKLGVQRDGPRTWDDGTLPGLKPRAFTLAGPEEAQGEECGARSLPPTFCFYN